MSDAPERPERLLTFRSGGWLLALTAFLGVEPGTQMSRSDVTKFVNAYIADKNLKAPPPNGRNIVLDDKLRDLLEPGEQQVTFLNLQRFLSKHIIKKST